MSISNTKLTRSQEEVMVYIMTSKTPENALTRIPQTIKHKIAFKQLQDIGAITANEDQTSLTDVGNDIMFNNGMVDDMGELTNEYRQAVVEGIVPFSLLVQVDNRIN